MSLQAQHTTFTQEVRDNTAHQGSFQTPVAAQGWGTFQWQMASTCNDSTSCEPYGFKTAVALAMPLKAGQGMKTS